MRAFAVVEHAFRRGRAVMSDVEVGRAITDALRAACLAVRVPAVCAPTSVGLAVRTLAMADAIAVPAVIRPSLAQTTDNDRLVADMFRAEGASLVRLVRLFVDDRNAAEDLVQEAFIRLARSAHRINDQTKAAAYLRSIVLNLARDHNRRGLVSLRHHLPFDDARASTEDQIELRSDQQVVIDALRDLPHRQRDCLVLRYYGELGPDEIASTLSISVNSVKTHLQRGLRALQERIAHGGIDVTAGTDAGRS